MSVEEMSASSQAISCSKPDCKVRETGSCIEGHQPREACPNFGSPTTQEIEVVGQDVSHDDVEEGMSAAEKLVPLPSGEALTTEDVERFLRWREANFIAIIGDSFSGKTTLVTAIYDRLLRGPFADTSFTGSWTLPALERLSHYARVESGRATPETPRTSIHDGLSYLHLALSDRLASPVKRVDLLISDRAGETYRRARDDSTTVTTLTEIPQAARVVLLLDGARVAKLDERAGAMQSIRQTLRVLLDNQAIGKNTAAQVVTTKIDILDQHEDSKVLREALAAFWARLKQDFEPRLGHLSFWEVSARDPTGKYAPAYGVDSLLREWVTQSATGPFFVPPPEGLKSQFDRLLLRTPEAQSL